MHASSLIQIVILAAGQGTRMKSTLPKILHPLGGRPVVHYVLDLAQQMSPHQTTLVVSPSLQEIQFPFPVQLVVQHPAGGTGDAVKQALPHLSSSGYVLILYGDTPLIQKTTLEKLIDLSHHHPETAVILLGMRPSSPEGYGRLLLNKEGGLEDIIEQKDLTTEQQSIPICNSGVMLVRADLLGRFLSKTTPHNAAREYYLPDIVKIARQEGYGCAVVEGEHAEFMGINTRQDLAEAETLLQQRWRSKALAKGVTLKDPTAVYFSYDTKISADTILHPFVVFGPGVTVEEGAEILSFCQISHAHIGPQTRVGPFAHLRGGVTLQTGAEIGNFVEVKHSTFGPHAKAKHLSYIGDAEVGTKANIGAGTITCNYDGFRKAKTIIGEEAFIGSNSALVAPVTIGKQAIVGAGSVVTKSIEDQGLAIARSQQTTIPKGAAAFRSKRKTEKDKE